MGKFKVTDLTTNNVIYSSMSAVAYEEFPIYGDIPYNGLFGFTFRDTEANCENSLDFYLRTIPGNASQLQYCNFSYNDWWRSENCSYANRTDIPIYLPSGVFVLIKQ